MDNASVEFIKEFTNQNAGLITGFFFVNIVTLSLETIVSSKILSKIFNVLNDSTNSDGSQLLKLMMLFVIIFISIRIGNLIKGILYNNIIPSFYSFLRSEMYNRIITRYKIDFKETNIGYILYNFEQLPFLFRRLLTELLQVYIPITLSLFISVCYLFYLNKSIGFIVSLCIIVLIVIILFTSSESITVSKHQYVEFQKGDAHVNDKLNNLFDIYTSGMENEEKQEFVDIENQVKSRIKKDFKYFTGISSSMDIVLIIMVSCSLYILYRAKSNNTMTKENIVTSIIMITHLVSYLSNFSKNYMNIIDAIGYSKESDRFINEINQKTETNAIFSNLNIDKNIFIGPIKFKNVIFRYTNKDVLRDINLTVYPRSKIAIYGKSGSGKSTIMKLLLGFYGLSEGEITIGGVNIKDIDVDELRKNISVVNQTVKLFDKTIIENILYGNNVISEENKEIVETTIRSPLFNNIEDPLNTPVGISGSKLSGGQKQIINVLRAIVKDSPILLLDEPTSSLDTESKELVMSIIRRIKNKTVIIITHDKSIMSYVDKSYQLVNGKIV